MQKEWQNAVIISHFVKISSYPSNLVFLLQRLCWELTTTHNIDIQIPQNKAPLTELFLRLLNLVKCKTIILIDSLDHLEDQEFAWLPHKLTSWCKLIVSKKTPHVLENKTKQCTTLPYWKNKETKNFIIEKIPIVDKKELNNVLRESCFLYSPLCLNLALGILKRSDISTLHQNLKLLSKRSELWSKNINCIEYEYEQKCPGLFKTLLSLLYCAKEGLTWEELNLLLIDIDPKQFYKSILYELRDLFHYREDIISIQSEQLQKFISQNISPQEKKECHDFLAHFFDQDQGNFKKRELTELLWQEIYANDYKQALKNLGNIDFLEAKIKAGMLSDLQQEIQKVLENIPQNFIYSITSEVAINSHILMQMANILDKEKMFLEKYPQSLFQTMWNYGYWYDCPEAQEHYTKKSGPWKLSGPKFYKLVEYWRCHKENQGIIWFKSLHPVPTKILSLVRNFNVGEEIIDIDISLDNKIAVASTYNSYYLWDCNGKNLHWSKDSDNISVCLSPDGAQLALGNYAGIGSVWDIETGNMLYKVTYKSQIAQIKFAPNGKMIAFSCDSGIYIHKLTSTKTFRILKSQSKPKSFYRDFDISPDSKKIAAINNNGEFLIWDVQTGKQTLIKKYKFFPTNIKFSLDSKKIATTNNFDGVNIWDVKTGEKLYQLAHSPTIDYIGIAFISGKLILCLIDRIELWDLRKKRLIYTSPIALDNEEEIHCMSLSKDGKKIVCGTTYGEVYIWYIEKKTSPLNLGGHQKPIYKSYFSGKKIVSADKEKICIWNTTGKITKKIVQKQKENIDVHISDKGQKIIIKYKDSLPELWDIGNGKFVRQLKSVCQYFSNQGDMMALLNAENIIIWDIVKQKNICQIDLENVLFNLVFSPDDSQVAITDLEGFKIYCSSTGKLLCELDIFPKDIIWRDNNQKLLISSPGPELYFLDLQNRRFETFYNSEMKFVIDFDFDKEKIVAQNSKKTYVWDIKTGSREKMILNQTDIRSYLNPDTPYQLLNNGAITTIRKKTKDKEETVASFPYKIDAKVCTNNKLIAPCSNYLYMLQICGSELPHL